MDAQDTSPALTRAVSLAGTAVVPPPGNGGAAVPALNVPAPSVLPLGGPAAPS